MMMDFPIASSFPKYFFSKAREMTTLLGCISAVLSFPSTRGIEKKLKKFESAKASLFSFTCWLLYFTKSIAGDSLVKALISG